MTIHMPQAAGARRDPIPLLIVKLLIKSVVWLLMMALWSMLGIYICVPAIVIAIVFYVIGVIASAAFRDTTVQEAAERSLNVYLRMYFDMFVRFHQSIFGSLSPSSGNQGKIGFLAFIAVPLLIPLAVLAATFVWVALFMLWTFFSSLVGRWVEVRPFQQRPLSSLAVEPDGIGNLEIGMSLDEASRALGYALVRTDEIYGSDSCYFVVPKNGPRGLLFMIVDGRIARIDVEGDEVSTTRGVRVGDSELTAKLMYLWKLEVESHQYNDEGHYMTYTSQGKNGDRYMVFETDGKVVESFRAGRRPEVRYVEHCL